MGSSGAFALYIGRDRLLGPSTAFVNGLKCTDVNLVTIRKNKHIWLRKYITTDATDGLTRVKTALRVAKAVYETQKPDLVQVVVLDKNVSTLQSDIRGRALGATVVYMPHADALGDGSAAAPITARYFSGGASDQGLFYGERIDMTTQDIDGVLASLSDHSDCADPVTTELSKEPEAGKHPKPKPAENAESGAAKTPDAETPPIEHPSPSTSDIKPDSGSTGSFIGVNAAAPAPPAPQLQVEATPDASLETAADAALARTIADPQTTGANR